MKNTKIAIRGLPTNTPPLELEEELRQHGLDPVYSRSIQGRNGRPGSIHFVELRGSKVNPKMYEINELLCMPGITIEPWRGKKRPAQCHRCQLFRHSSHNCHRPLACVRCGESHTARDCPRPKERPATCANCGGEHPANHTKCPVFQRELRNRRAGTLVKTEDVKRVSRPAPPPVQDIPSEEATQRGSLMAAANPPSSRTTKQPPKKHKRNRKRRRLQVKPMEVEELPPPSTATPETSKTSNETAGQTRPTTNKKEAIQDIFQDIINLANKAHQLGATGGQIKHILQYLLNNIDETTENKDLIPPASSTR